MVKDMEHGQFTGWQIFSTDGPHSTIPQPFIEDAALIIEKMITTGEIKLLKDCIEKLQYHISKDLNPHDVSIVNFAAAILHNLYLKYRTLGYVTDQEEMYRRMFYDLDVATWAEVKAKEEATKALTVPGFRYLTDAHDSDLHAHSNIFANLLDSDPCPYTPSISIKYHSCEAQLSIDPDGYPIYIFKEDFCPTQGTLVVGLEFVVGIAPIPVLSLIGDTMSLDLVIDPAKMLSLMYTINNTPTLLFQENLLVTNGNIQVAFTYTKNKLYLKSTISAHTQTIELNDFNLLVNFVKFIAPLKRIDPNGCIKSFWYYPNPIVSGSMLNAVLTS